MRFKYSLAGIPLRGSNTVHIMTSENPIPPEVISHHINNYPEDWVFYYTVNGVERVEVDYE